MSTSTSGGGGWKASGARTAQTWCGPPCSGTLGYLSILGHPSGLHWAAALLFALPACYLVLSWAGRRVLGTRLAYLIQHRDVRQRYG